MEASERDRSCGPMRALRILGGVALALLCGAAGSARAASLESIGSFNEPIYVASDPGDANRLFVVERLGRIEQVQGGSVTLFANLESAVGCGGSCSGERGLLSIALAPDFDASGRLYVDYANDVSGEIHVAEAVVHKAGEAFALRDLLVIPHPGAANHNGGQLQFGPEGDLYVSTGDGGGADDEFHNAQSLESRLGKILRLEPDPGGPSPFYKVPAGNPFAGVAGDAPEIWSYGLRNPFRFSFDRLTGAIAIGDVGQGAREEVDYATGPLPGRKADYGWNCREGLIAGPGDDLPGEGCETTPFLDPVFDYPHEDPGGGRAHGCAIIGGYVDREAVSTALTGRYLYGDLCTGEIRSLDLGAPFSSDRSEGLVVANLNSFGEDSAGRLYAVSGDGPVYRILSPPLPLPPAPPTHALLGIEARQKVRRGGRATITAFVSPCVRSAATTVMVSLYRGRRRLQTRHLSRVCTVDFRPRISRRATFHAKLIEDSTYLAAESRRLTIQPRRRLRAR
jgi:Glucose / Sorbosone dehydrogenase